MPELRTCKVCGKELPLTMFYAWEGTNHRIARLNKCKSCHRLQRIKKAEEARLNAPTRKTCPICKQDLDINQFSHSYTTNDGYHTYCKKCASKKSLEYYFKNKKQ